VLPQGKIGSQPQTGMPGTYLDSTCARRKAGTARATSVMSCDCRDSERDATRASKARDLKIPKAFSSGECITTTVARGTDSAENQVRVVMTAVLTGRCMVTYADDTRRRAVSTAHVLPDLRENGFKS
jgi:hypothetical protein